MENTEYTHAIEFHGNDFDAVSRPTTEEDNHFGVVERYDLFQNDSLVGKIAIWNGCKFGFLKDGIRIVLPKIDLHVRQIELA